MIRWARLNWQAADPAALAADLGRRLGAAFAAHPAVTGAFLLSLGTADLEVVPWRRESPADDPAAGGRLVFEPAGNAAPDALPDPSPSLALTLVGVAWCTVDIERAEADLAPWLEPAPASGRPADGTDPHLGARSRVRGAPGLPGEVLVLSEPVTEGRLAASLARDDEGPCGLYLRPAGGLDAWIAGARARHAAVSAVRRGPFGRSVLVRGTPVAGPHLLLVDAPRPSSGNASPGTIAP